MCAREAFGEGQNGKAVRGPNGLRESSLSFDSLPAGALVSVRGAPLQVGSGCNWLGHSRVTLEFFR